MNSMPLTLRQYWELLRSSYWFIPSLLCLAAASLACVMIFLDALILRERSSVPDWLYQGSPEGARAVLSTIGGSMIGIAGVVFSINTVALTLASGQFGPRLMRNFLRDRANQTVLGTFLASFLYCLIVLVTVQGRESYQFTPRAAIAVAILLAVVGLGMLIFFIHHVLISIQATHVVLEVGSELRRAIDQLLPQDEQPEAESPGDRVHNLVNCQSAEIVAPRAGYVVGLNADQLTRTAAKYDAIVEVVCRPGHYLIPGECIAKVIPPERINSELTEAIQSAFTLSRQRFALEDLEFTIDQLVEIAVRSLSPGINDPFTAMHCIDVLSEALGLIAGRRLPPRYRYENDALRLILHPVTLGGLLDAALHQIRQYGHNSPAVMIRVLESLAPVAKLANRAEDRHAIGTHARLFYEAGQASFAADQDRNDLSRRYEKVVEQLQR